MPLEVNQRASNNPNGRYTILVDGGWALFRYKADEPPKSGQVIEARTGKRFLAVDVSVDEATDRVTVRAVSCD